MSKVADLSGIELPVVMSCKNCRFSQEHRDIGYLECRCPRQDGWGDRAANEDFNHASTVREYHCHGAWFELKMPDPPRGFQRFLYWLQRQSRDGAS